MSFFVDTKQRTDNVMLAGQEMKKKGGGQGEEEVKGRSCTSKST